jgi:hypothetical protein
MGSLWHGKSEAQKSSILIKNLSISQDKKIYIDVLYAVNLLSDGTSTFSAIRHFPYL